MEKRKKILIIANGNYGEKPYGTLIDNTNYFDKVIRLSWYEIGEKDKKYIGTRTDINCTIWWKYREKYDKRDIILINNFPKTTIGRMNDIYRKKVIEDRYDNLQQALKNTNKIIHVHNIGDDEEIQNFFCENLSATEKIKKSLRGCNFSLGFRSIYIALKLFPNHDIYTHGFDFFTGKRETGGYYWDKQHNRHRANRHPYIYEKMCYEKMVKNKVVYKLNSVSKVQ